MHFRALLSDALPFFFLLLSGNGGRGFFSLRRGRCRFSRGTFVFPARGRHRLLPALGAASSSSGFFFFLMDS